MKIDRYIAIIRPPMIIPKTDIIMGWISEPIDSTALSTCISYWSATLPNISSSVPDSSPIEVICSRNIGKIPVARVACSHDRSEVTSLRICLIAPLFFHRNCFCSRRDVCKAGSVYPLGSCTPLTTRFRAVWKAYPEGRSSIIIGR